jgi:hypothetical protein
MRIFFFIAALALIISCNNDMQEYESLMQKEINSGHRADSLFFGIYLGMPAKEFYMHCWELNKQGIFTDGNNNTAVLYKLHNNELKYNATMNFYPEFRNNNIYKMWATFQYDGWAPWNKHMYSDSLLQDVLKLYKSWYSGGNPFIEMHDKERGTIYIKVDGNRRIIIGRYSDMIVKVDYTDLLVEK